MSYGVMAPTTVEQAPYTILATKTVGPWFDVSRWRRGAVRVPAGATVTSFTFNVSNDHDGVGGGVAYSLRDGAGVAISQTVVANKWFPLPASAFSYRFLQFVPNAPPAGNLGLTISGVDGPATWRRISAPIASGGTVTSNIDLAGATAGSFLTPTGFQGATVKCLVGGGGSDLNAAVDVANADLTVATAADRLLPLPREAFGASALALLAATPQSAARVVDVWLKQEG